MAEDRPLKPLSSEALLQLQDYLGLNLKVLQDICQQVSDRVPCDISIMAEGGTIVASSIPGRVGKRHAVARQLLEGDQDGIDVTPEMAEASPVMLEGCNRPILLDGVRIASVGINAPLDKARDYAAIVQTCMELMLQAHLANWRDRQVLTEQVDQAQQALKEESVEKQQVEASLVRSERRLKDITDFMFDLIWETGPDHRFTYVSENLPRYMGWKPEDVLNRTRWELLEPHLINKDEEAWRQHQEDIEAHRDFRDFHYCVVIPGFDPKHIIVSGKAVFDEDGEFLGYRGVTRDATPQYEAEEALRESEMRFQHIAESSSDWIWVMDENLRFTYLSDRFYEITGVAPEDILGKTREEFAGAEVVQADPQKWEAHLEDLRQRRRIKEFDYYGFRADGQRYCIKINGSPYFRSDGSFAGYHGTGTDYSELNHARAQLLRSEKLAALGSMVAGVAHEINTPVGNALTAASYIQSETQAIVETVAKGKLTRSILQSFLDESQETSGILLQNLDRAIRLINNFKQVAVDQSSDQVRTFNLGEYIDSVSLSLQTVLKQGGHRLDYQCPKALKIYSEPGALYQVLTNLVMNSLDHGFADGRRGQILIEVMEDADQVQIHYRDDGVGMTEEQQRRMFEPFYTTRRGSGNTGLGMYLVHTLVNESLQGSISCRSLPGTGAHFLLKLPKRLVCGPD